MRVSTLTLVAFVLAASSAGAASREVLYDAAPAWVRPPPAETQGSSPAGAPARIVYSDQQVHLGKNGAENYSAYRIKILRPEALAAGNLVAAWNPDTDDLIVHRLNIIRDGKVLDVLATTKFRVMERADKLEYAVLDGALTAALQTPGLQVGDELEFAATIRRRDLTFGGRSTGALQLPILSSPGAYRTRLTWPKDSAVLWRATPDLGPLAPRAEGSEQVLQDELRDPGSVPLTDGAPPRFNLRRRVEFSQFAAWSEISQALRPLFERAATLAPNSPVHAEAAKIAAATSDPGSRAEEALRLVQDRIRYVYVEFGGGGYRPASADDTWSRKFGDCKAKSVLLTALLRELGIESELVLVASAGGDGMDQLLPTPAAFDHILVRAKISGKAYWLDGTRVGDRRLSALPAPRSRWALAIRPTPVELEPVALEAPVVPQLGALLEVDASRGFDVLAKVRAEQVLRGDEVQQIRTQLSSLSPDDAERAVKAYFRREYSWVEPDTATWRYDDVGGALVLAMAGDGKPDWEGDEDGKRSLDIYSAGFSPPNQLRRPKEQDQAAPWMTDFPAFKRWTTVIRLPPETAKWRWNYSAAPVDEQLGGVAYWREAVLSGGVMRTTMSRRALVPEISAAEARAISDRLPAFDNNISRVFQAPGKDPSSKVRAPDAGAQNGLPADVRRLLASTPASSEEIASLRRAMDLVNKGQISQGLAVIDSAGALIADNPGASLFAAVIATHVGADDRALSYLDAGLQRRPREVALLLLRVALNTKAGRRQQALADADVVIRERPEAREGFLIRAKLLNALNRPEEALVDLDEAGRIDPLDSSVLVERSWTLHRLNRETEAIATLEPGIASDVTGNALNVRCWIRATSNLDLVRAEADCAQAVKLAPAVAAFWDSYALVALRAQRLDDALARYDHALVLAPKMAAPLYGRGITKIRRGDQSGGSADIAAAKAIDPDVARELTAAGVIP